MNRLDALPEALSDYIYYLRDCATTIQIQTAWRKYKAQITMLKKLQNDCQWIDQGYGLYSKRLNVRTTNENFENHRNRSPRDKTVRLSVPSERSSKLHNKP